MKLVHRMADSFPIFAVAVWATMFAFAGTSLPVVYENLWRFGAAVVAVVNGAVAFLRDSDRRRFIAGTVAIVWLMSWAGYLGTAWGRGDDALSIRLSPVAIGQFLLIAILIGWLYGRRPMGRVVADMNVMSDE